MRVAVFDKPHQPLHIESRSTPDPGAGEVVVKVERCGICGSDIHWTEEHAYTVASGTVMGHEFAGEIVAVGAEVADLRTGDRVCCVPFTGCGVCIDCRNGDPFWCACKRSTWGGFGQFTVVSASSCVTLGDSMSWADGALVEPLACGLHALRVAQLPAGVSALVIGAGPIGLSCVYWLRRFHAHSIAVTARTSRRESLATSMGASSFFPAGGESLPAASSLTEAPDVVFECTGVPGLIQRAMEIARPRGTVVVAGLCMRPDTFKPAMGLVKQLRLVFSAAYTVGDFQKTVDALGSGDLSPRGMITSVISLDELPVAFEAMRRGTDECKILIDPWAP
jgi:(R,R)-butanediol dehydrogenase/meso-butanediol dehydrogenase/diacetyl reductase